MGKMDPNTRPGTIDIVNALRLLWGRADDETRPILKAAEEEIKRLRRIYAAALVTAATATTDEEKIAAWQSFIEVIK